MRSVLITGAAGGMGRAAAELLSKSGYRVFALDLKECEPMENVIPISADVTSYESVFSAFQKVRGMTDSLYAMIHFAGIYMLDSLVEMGEEDFSRIFRINVFGAFNVNKIFMPLLSRGSRILITTSELAPLDPLPFTGIYAVSKSALDKYAYSLRMELQLLGIGVSVLRAGAVATDMLGVSTRALDRFTEKTKIYSCNAKKFKSIVDRVEARCIPPEKIAKKCHSILKKKKARFAYAVNRNPLLLLLSALPQGMQLWIIGKILKNKGE